MKGKDDNVEKVNGELVNKRGKLGKLASGVKDGVVQGSGFVFDKATASFETVTIKIFTSSNDMLNKQYDSLEKDNDAYRRARDIELMKEDIDYDRVNYYENMMDKNKREQTEIRKEQLKHSRETMMAYAGGVATIAGTVIAAVVTRKKI